MKSLLALVVVAAIQFLASASPAVPAPLPTMTATSNATIYFGYGSNLWKHQMQQRCPTSEYLGIAQLADYRWIINDRGYANVVEIPGKDDGNSSRDEVWGLVYSLQKEDERRLDLNEGVPIAYTKENITTSFWPANSTTTASSPKDVEMLVYIDRNRTTPDTPKKEYIYRMNMGIKDAIEEGVPQEYVSDVLRKFIPADEDEGVAKFAQQQAIFFRDEN